MPNPGNFAKTSIIILATVENCQRKIGGVDVMPFIRYRGAALAKGPILKKGHHSSYRHIRQINASCFWPDNLQLMIAERTRQGTDT
jgi:hypothetical protein